MSPFITDLPTIQSKINQDDFSGVILIASHGKPLVKLASGFANTEQKIPNTIDTKFNIGSSSKMFTAIAIAQIAQKGLLDFNDPIGKYLKINPDIRTITIHQLLTHTGGTGDIFGPEFEANLEKLKNPSDYIDLFGYKTPEFPPGSRFSYSNYGFILLGAIIESISKQSYYDYIRQNIYQIAGMTSSDSFWKTETISNMATGYIRTENGHLQSNQSCLPMRGTPTGGSYSTAEDLLRFVKALQSHQLLNAELTNLVITGKVTTPDHQKYGYGFRDRIEYGKHWIGHSGGGPGANSTLRIFPELDYIIIVLSNFDYPAADRLADFVVRKV